LAADVTVAADVTFAAGATFAAAVAPVATSTRRDVA
jgi:hypothetical protein